MTSIEALKIEGKNLTRFYFKFSFSTNHIALNLALKIDFKKPDSIIFQNSKPQNSPFLPTNKKSKQIRSLFRNVNKQTTIGNLECSQVEFILQRDLTAIMPIAIIIHKPSSYYTSFPGITIP